jgi:uncharacterized coiled-coil protein SlyX
MARMEREFSERITALEEWIASLQATVDRLSSKLDTGSLRLRKSIDTMGSLLETMESQRGEIVAQLDPETLERAGAGRTFLNPFTPLVSQLAKSFDLGELAGLAYDVGIDMEELDGSGLLDSCRRLVAYAKRRQKLDTLLELAAKERPNIDWLSFRIAPDAVE